MDRLLLSAAAASLAGVSLFLVGFAVFCVLRGWRIAHTPGSAIAFAPGALPWLADGSAAFTLMALALGIQLALGGDARRLR